MSSQNLKTVKKLLYNSIMRKYKNIKVEYDGYTFDSLAEKSRYVHLRNLERTGKIENLRVHSADIKFVLIDKFEYLDITGKKHKVREATYTPDFLYTEKGIHVAEDLKGFKTELFNFKAKLFRSRYPTVILRIVRFRGGVKMGYTYYDD